jgi:hypothetical protein
MDCQTFDSSLIDALYDELDADASSAMDEHGAGCDRCALRAAQVKKIRELVRPSLEDVTLPEGMDARLLAATEAAMDEAAEAKREADAAAATERGEGAKIYAFLARPQLAVAAAFLLVLGAALFVNTSKRAPARSASESAAASPAASATAAENTEPAETAIAAAATPVVAAAPPGAAPPPAPRPSPAGPLVASADDLADSYGGATEKAWSAGAGRSLAKAANEPSSPSTDPAFTAAKALFDAGRYAEALPKFEALAPSSADAELYAARCIARTQGCSAAAPRYDSAAQRSAGTERASRAALETARCLKNEGQASAARSRYANLTSDAFVAREANADLAALDAPKMKAAAKPGAPAATTTAASPARAGDVLR